MDGIVQFLKVQYSAVAAMVRQLYSILIPEYPDAGMAIVDLTVLVLVFYLVKSGPRTGLKMGLIVFVSLTILAVVVHNLNRSLHLGLGG